MLLELSREGGVRRTGHDDVWGTGEVGRDSLRARDFLDWKTLVLSRRRDWIDLAQDLDNW